MRSWCTSAPRSLRRRRSRLGRCRRRSCVTGSYCRPPDPSSGDTAPLFPPIGPGTQVVADLSPANVGGVWSFDFAPAAGAVRSSATVVQTRAELEARMGHLELDAVKILPEGRPRSQFPGRG